MMKRELKEAARYDKASIDRDIREGFRRGHRWHNRFHLEMPYGFLSAPSGLCWWKGEYHIFANWNPFGCESDEKCWIHTSTRDFISYSLPEMALWPDAAEDSNGCGYGCACTEDGHMRIVYTGATGGSLSPVQRFGTWLKAEKKIRRDEIAINTIPDGFGDIFRGPHIFKRNGTRYMILGTNGADKDGCAVIYREENSLSGEDLLYEAQEESSEVSYEGDSLPVSSSGKKWTFLGRIQTRYDGKPMGYIWENPSLLHFGSYDVLAFCPKGLEPQTYAWQNLYQSGYMTGKISFSSMKFLGGEFQEFDKGFDFYAPQIFEHAGRHFMIGWMCMPDRTKDYPTIENGWMGNFTMPRELVLRQGHIYSKPSEEMKSLRIAGSEQEIHKRDIVHDDWPLAEGAEALLNIRMGNAESIEVSVRYGIERLTFRFDRRTQVVEIDRSEMKNGGRGVRRFMLSADDRLNLRLFVDHSAVEAFLQYGEEAASLLVFPEKYILPELALDAHAPIAEITGTIWKLDGMKLRA